MAKGIYDRKVLNGVKAQAVAKLEDRYKAIAEQSQTQGAFVSPEMKEAISKRF